MQGLKPSDFSQNTMSQNVSVNAMAAAIDNVEKKKPRKAETDQQRRERMNVRNLRDKQLRDAENSAEKTERCRKRREADNLRHNKVTANPDDVDDRKKRRREKDKERRGGMTDSEKESFNSKRRDNHKKRKEKLSVKDGNAIVHSVDIVPTEQPIQPANIASLQAYTSHISHAPAAVPPL